MASSKLPSSSGGIVQYFEDSKTKFSLTPMQVMIATGIVVVLVILFNLINPLGL
jgi:preprotein translocase subunit Sec61beta